MLRVLTAAQMREADRITIEEKGIPGLILMENAGAAVVGLLLHELSPLSGQRILILCGKGNNGGDGLVAARHLIVRRLADPTVVLFAAEDELSEDAAANLRMLRAAGADVETVTSVNAWRELRDRTLPATVVVDALLGTGIQGAVRGLLGDVIADLNANWKHARLVAVDIPSGMPSDEGESVQDPLRADHTVTFTAPKLSQVLLPNAARVGRLHIARIGTSDDVVNSLGGVRVYLSEPADFCRLFRPRDLEAHKGSFGHVAVVGGSRSRPGAAAMAGTAALRAGTGLCTVVTAAGATAAVIAVTPELMTEPVAELDDGTMRGFDIALLAGKDVVAVGPGLGVSEPNLELVRRILTSIEVPIVVDADALRVIGEQWRSGSRAVVATPHPGEMARMTGRSTAEVQRDRLSIARDFAERRGVITVLKGARTVIACPDGRVFINPTGTPAMATGGAGDILTGLIAGLLAQFPGEAPETVVTAGVWLHGRAGEVAAERWGEQALLATDLLDALPRAMSELR
jgi:NAD(P)H-hydrate epimerase